MRYVDTLQGFLSVNQGLPIFSPCGYQQPADLSVIF